MEGKMSPATTSSDVISHDRLFYNLYKKIEQLENEVVELKKSKILDETKIPQEILEENNLLPSKPKKLRRGIGYRPILRCEIEDALKQSQSIDGQARYLGINKITYKKYATLYGLYKVVRGCPGSRRRLDPDTGRYPLNEILNGTFNDNPNITDFKVKDKLFKSGYLPLRCNLCGYSKRRIVDNKSPLVLDHKDGNLRNFKLENLQFLCLNCAFECGRGYMRNYDRKLDVDWMQNIDYTSRKDKAIY